MKILSDQWKLLLKSRAELFDIYLNDRQLNNMAAFASELIGFNAKFNLTAITGPEEIIEKHLLDSVIPAKFIPENASVIDIGTGGGLPGIALKIYKPSLCMTLIDASRKKINFLKYIIRSLELRDVTAIQIRAEDLGESKIASTGFDVVISRAVTSLTRLISFSVPVLKDDGLLMAMKGKPDKVHAELIQTGKLINAGQYLIDADRLKIETETYHLPVSDSYRSLVLVWNKAGASSLMAT